MNVKTLWVEYYQIAVGCSIITYFHVSKDYLSLAKLVRWVLIFITITSALTIFFYTQIVETTVRLGWEEWYEDSKIWLCNLWHDNSIDECNECFDIFI